MDDEFFRLLHSLGLGDALKQHAKYPISYDYVSPLGLSLGFVQGRITEHNFPNRAAIFQPEFEKLLAGAALDTQHVTIEFNREVLRLNDENDCVQVTAHGANGETLTYRAQYVVGADGAHSVCRKHLGLPLNEVDKFDVRHVVIDVVDDIDPSPMALTKMGWRRNFFSMPAPNGRRFEFSLRPDETPEQLLDDDTLRRLFKPWRNYDDLKVIRKVVHTFRSRIVPQLSVGRIFLAGDAAHLMPIFGSQGMNSGARDANNLGWKLAMVIRHGASPALLDTYHEERWEAVLKTIRMATINGKLQKVQSIPMSLLRDLFFGLLRLIPAATRYIREMRYIPKPFLRSSLVRPAHEKGASKQLIGRILPNPGVTVSGQGHLLDEVAGNSFALIGIDTSEGDVGAASALARRFFGNCIIVTQAASSADTDVHVNGQYVRAQVADNRFDGIFETYRGQWLLVRPDRVVAAAGPLSHLQADASAILETMFSEQHSSSHPAPPASDPSPSPVPA